VKTKAALQNKHFLFVTDEYYPINNGGIARLLNTISNELMEAGCSVTILMSTENFEAVRNYKKKIKEDKPLLKVFTVNEVLGNSPYDNFFPRWVKLLDRMHLSYRCALAIRTLCNEYTFDAIELNDCWGYGYAFQQWRVLWNEPFTTIPTWVRLHGSMENCMIADQINIKDHFHPYHYNFFQMERRSLQMADGIISPSNAVAKWYEETYSLGAVPIAMSVPSFETLGKFNQHPRRIDSTPFRILFYGRIQHLKGVETIVKAVVELITKRGLSIEFNLYGSVVGDYGQYLNKLIPENLQDNIKFHGAINPVNLPEIAKKHHVAVISSKLETFCLAAHELNWIGIPLILNNIAAFKDFFKDGENCYFYDSSVKELEKALLRFFSRRYTELENNAQKIKALHNTVITYSDILEKSSPPNDSAKYPLLDHEQYLSVFYYLVFHMHFDSEEMKKMVNTTEKKMKINSPFINKAYSKSGLEELNTLMLLSTIDSKDTEYAAQNKVSALEENSNYYQNEQLRIREELTNENIKLKNWYNDQYEVLPLWYKRFGHIIKVLRGNRSIKSVVNKNKPQA